MKRIYKYFWSISFAGILFGGCRIKQSDEIVDLPVIKFNEVSDSVKLTDKFKNITGIQLEMTDDSMIGEIDRVIPVGNELVVLADNEIFIFSRDNGKFLRTVGSVGEGPDEYIEMTDISYDPGKKEIVGLDRLKNEFIVFGIDGRFIRKKKIDRPMAYITGFERGSDGTILICSRMISRDPESAFTILTPTGEIEEIDKFYPLYSESRMSRWAAKPMSACGEEIKFVKMLTDTLYQIRDGKETAIYKLDLGKPVPSKETISKFGEFDLDYVDVCLGNGWSPGIDKMYETKDYIVLVPHRSQYEGQYWIDKSNYSGFHLSATPLFDDEVKKAVKGKAILKLIGSDEETLISCFNPAIIPLCFGKAFAEGFEDVVFPESVIEAIENVDPEGNPFLIIYSNS